MQQIADRAYGNAYHRGKTRDYIVGHLDFDFSCFMAAWPPVYVRVCTDHASVA